MSYSESIFDTFTPGNLPSPPYFSTSTCFPRPMKLPMSISFLAPHDLPTKLSGVPVCAPRTGPPVSAFLTSDLVRTSQHRPIDRCARGTAWGAGFLRSQVEGVCLKTGNLVGGNPFRSHLPCQAFMEWSLDSQPHGNPHESSLQSLQSILSNLALRGNCLESLLWKSSLSLSEPS